MEDIIIDGNNTIDVLIDSPPSGQPSACIVICNGLGHASWQWPTYLINNLSQSNMLIRWNYRGMNDDKYEPTLCDMLSDLNLVMKCCAPSQLQVPCFLLGYSLGGIFAQAVMDSFLAPLFKGYILIATAHRFTETSSHIVSFKPASSMSVPPLGDPALLKTIFSRRRCETGAQRLFVGGSPEEWYIEQKPQIILNKPWEESILTHGLRRFMWLFPPAMRSSIMLNKSPYTVIFGKQPPSSYGDRYFNVAENLFYRGGLVRRFLDSKQRSEREHEEPHPFSCLLVHGSQDGIFPVEYFFDLFDAIRGRKNVHVTACLYNSPTETSNSKNKDIHEYHIQPAGHGMMYQDSILHHVVMQINNFLKS